MNQSKKRISNHRNLGNNGHRRYLVVNALGVLSQHLVVLLDPSSIVATMHDAYAQIDLTGSPYGVFIAGPSATGDIEGVIIHGAQGARSMTILILAGPVDLR
jgi:L-lactate dehydrogenase complex protein LldG